MHIIEQGALVVGSAVVVHSHGHTYNAKVVELKGKRARCQWVNKSGNEFDNWITIPSLSERTTNPLAAKTRKLRVQATTRERHANKWMAESIARLESIAADYRSGLKAVERGETDIAKIGVEYTGRISYLCGLGDPSWQLKDFVALSLRDAVAKVLEETEQSIAQQKAQQAESLAEAKALRAEADALVAEIAKTA